MRVHQSYTEFLRFFSQRDISMSRFAADYKNSRSIFNYSFSILNFWKSNIIL